MAFRAAARGGQGQSVQVNNVAIVIPATAVAGDVAIVLLSCSSNPTMASPPTGWTLESGPDGDTSNVFRGFLLSADITASGANAPGASVTFTISFAARIVGTMLVFSGRTRTGMQVGTPVIEGTAVSTHVLPNLTGVPANADLFGGVARRRANTAGTITASAGWTEPTNGDVSTTYGAAVANTWAQGAYILNSAGGSITGGSWTGSVTSTGVNYLVALPESTVTQTADLPMAATSGMVIGGRKDVSGGLVMAGTSALALAGRKDVSGVLAASATSSLTLSGVRSQLAALSVAATSSMVLANAATGKVAVLPLSALSSLTIAPSPVTRSYTLTLSATASAAISGRKDVGGVWAPSATATFVIAGLFPAAIAMRATPAMLLGPLVVHPFTLLPMSASSAMLIFSFVFPDYRPHTYVYSTLVDLSGHAELDQGQGYATLVDGTGHAELVPGDVHAEVDV